MAKLTAERMKYLRETPRHLRHPEGETPVAPKNSRGLGDTIAKVIHKVSGGKIKPCGGCKRRQKVLNKIVPYKK